MKKLFLGLAVVVGSMAFAQQFGLKAGANLSDVSGNGYDNAKSKFGYYAGVFMNLPVSEDFSIQPEVLYNSLGYKMEYSAGKLASYKSTNNLEYISVPVMFQYKFVPNFYMEAGPEFDFLVRAKSNASTNVLGVSANIGNLIGDIKKEDFNTFNFRMGIGAGFNFTQNIGINARYTAGLTDITKSSSNGKTNNFQLGLNYKF